jgi:hypothetical protein
MVVEKKKRPPAAGAKPAVSAPVEPRRSSPAAPVVSADPRQVSTGSFGTVAPSPPVTLNPGGAIPLRAKLLEAESYRIDVRAAPDLKELNQAILASWEARPGGGFNPTVRQFAAVRAPTGIEGGKNVEISWQGDPALLRGGVANERISEVKLHYRFVNAEGIPGRTETVGLLAGGLTARVTESSASIPVPQAANGKLEYWFEVHTDHDDARGGVPLWDSRGLNDNYSVPVMAKNSATVHFAARPEAPLGSSQWAEWVQGTVTAGQTVDLAFDPDRFRILMGLGDQNHHGGVTFTALAQVSFDHGKPVDVPLTTLQRGQVLAYAVPVKVPENAKRMRVHFSGGGAWDWKVDDNHRLDYVFDVAPAGPADPDGN